MILKNSFFKLLKEDFKARKLELALSVVVFFVLFILIPLQLLPIELKRMLTQSNRDGLIITLFGYNNMLVYIVTFVGALICSIHSMDYLFSRQKTDFYHSLPVSREKLFFCRYVNSILFYVIPYAVTLLVGEVLCVLFLRYPLWPWASVGEAFVYHTLAYCMFLNLDLLIIMLSGRLITVFLGVVATNVYGLFWVMILHFYRCEFLFCIPVESVSVMAIDWMSPVCNYFTKWGGKDEHNLPWLMVVVTVSSLVIALLLYRHRPSAASGDTLAFPKFKSLLRGMVMLPVSVLGGIFMYIIYHQIVFWIFGVCATLCGCHIVLQALLEHGNIRALRKNLPVVGVVLLLALMIGAVYRYDIFHINSSLPKTKNVESYSICFEQDYNGKWEQDVSSASYREKKMKITDGKLMRKLAKLGYACRKKRTYEPDEENVNDRCEFRMIFHLKNGKKLERVYTIDDSSGENREICYQLLENAEFKISKKIFSMDRMHDYLILKGIGKDGKEQSITLNREQRQDMLDAMRVDVMESKAKQQIEDTQIGCLVICTPYTQDQHERILSSYKETIKLMKTWGLQTEKKTTFIDCSN